MSRKYFIKVKRVLSSIVAIAIVATMMPAASTAAEDVIEKYPYTMFAASKAEGAITVNAGNFCVNGKVTTNGTIVSSGNMNVNGTKTENANENMIYILDKIDSVYFSNDNVNEYLEDYALEEININITVPTEVDGEATFTGNININTALKALEDINLYGEVKNTDNSVIFSKYGNVIIDSTNVNLNGLVYAPFGNVEILAQNINLNNVVIIAQSITIDGISVNANYSSSAGELVGTTSELLYISSDEWQYMEDSNENGLPDFFEDYNNWRKMVDTDGEGLPDSIEDFINTDRLLIDTDGDGLNDFYELFGTLTDPTLYDSDENGVSDGDEDFDNDSLSNLQEYENGTKPYNEDTDEDGLSDGDEVNVYGTNPLVSDTDKDGLEDADEIYFGCDPLDSDTDDDGILDGDEKRLQTFVYENKDSVIEEVIISMEATGNLQKTTEIRNIMDKDVICSGVVGLVGEPFSVETDSQFDTATISFRIDKSKLDEIKFEDLIFLWYDEQNYEFIELETLYDEESSIVSIETTHFSKYMIVDKYKWFEAWAVTFNYNPNKKNTSEKIVYNTVLAIDCSGSMHTYDPIVNKSCKRIQAAEGFIDNMNRNDKAGIVLFTSTASIAAKMTTNETETLKLALQKVTSSGGTSFDAAILKSISAFASEDIQAPNTNNRIILLTDGESSVSTTSLSSAIEKEIKIYTIGLGSGTNDIVLKYIADLTGGEFYKVYTADELVDVYTEIGFDDDFDTTDTDGDGLYDAVEAAGIRIQNGTTIYGCDPTSKDTDNDGLEDGEEIDPTIRWRAKHYYASDVPDYAIDKEYFFVMKSDPRRMDTDNDGLWDGKEVIYNDTIIAPADPDPLNETGPTGLWKMHILQIVADTNTAYQYSNDYYEPVSLKGELKFWGIIPYWENNLLDVVFSSASSFGSVTLDFRYDDQHIAIHSDTTQWQAIGGYNDFYDWVFNAATSMDKLKLNFNVYGQDFVIWAWKGNYLNLGAGSEVGFYTQNSLLEGIEDFTGLEQWMVGDVLPMTLSLYRRTENGYYNYYHWLPYMEQWWITGFVPDINNSFITAEELVQIASVDFSGYPASMYINLKERYEKNRDYKDTIYFDDHNRMIWLVW